MRVNYILVDYENVQPKDFNLVAHESFRVLVFVGAKQKSLSAEMALILQGMGPRAEYVRISGAGKNALDFHIAYHIGRLASHGPEAFFHIISKDTGFDPLLLHLKGNGVLAARHPNLSEIPILVCLQLRTPAQRASMYLKKLRLPKSTRPGTTATLSNHIASHFGKTLSDSEIADVVQELSDTEVLKIDGKKVVYRDPNVVPFVSPVSFPEKQGLFAGAKP